MTSSRHHTATLPRPLRTVLTCSALSLAFTAQQLASQDYSQRPPLIAPEANEWQATSSSEQVREFLTGLERLPAANRLSVSKFGETNEGRDMVVVKVAAPGATDQGKLRILINANIHGGEVEGKESVQLLLREFAYGDHADLLEQAVIWFVPIYNLDGNDRIDARNRRGQNGPDLGVGVRPNAQQLDLNRDFIKAESPECRALIGLVREHDPHLFMDLHTTNGSSHGYHLTYSPSLATNVDPAIDRFMRDMFLPETRANTLEVHGYRVFDYGNFSRGGGQRGRGRPGRQGGRGRQGRGQGRGQGGGRGRGGAAAAGPRRWATYDHRPRFGTNYIGLRNRLSVLSEALSYVDFRTRILATRGFVLENIKTALRHKDAIEALCAAADRRVTEPDAAVYFGYDTTLVDGTMMDILVGSREQLELPDGRTRSVAGAEFQPEPMRVQVAYRSRKHTALPAAWAIPEPTASVMERLATHGIEVQALTRATVVPADVFRPTSIIKSQRPFQGHNELSLEGSWHPAEQTLPAGTIVIAARQRLARVAAQLLEPMSEDSLSTWNAFEEQTAAGENGQFPVLHLSDVSGLPLAPASRRQPPPEPREAPEIPGVPHDIEGIVRRISLQRRSNGELELLSGETADLILAELSTEVGRPLRRADLLSWAELLWLDKNVRAEFEVTEAAQGLHLRIVIPHVE